MSRQPAPSSTASAAPKRRAHAPDYLLLTTVLVLGWLMGGQERP